jgi:hypothetical protein
VEPAVDAHHGAGLVTLQVERPDVELVVQLRELGEDDLIAAVEQEAVDDVGAHSAADVVAGFEHGARDALAGEQTGAGQSRETAAHDAHIGSCRHRKESPMALVGFAAPPNRIVAMDLRFSAEDEAFRAEARAWLTTQLEGEFADVRGRGGPGDEHSLFEERLAWEQALGRAGWIGISWPTEYGGRGLSLSQQVIFYEEYARAGGPGRVGHIGEGLLGPTIIHFGSEEQKRRFLPPILAGTEVWCQGYSEPNAGSDLANVQTRATLDGDEWVIEGQKVWTSLAHWSQWCFVLCRTDRDAMPKHRGISYLLVPMDQPGIEIRPIEQVTGTSEFN